jgi:3-oxoadipate enol-lactonase
MRLRANNITQNYDCRGAGENLILVHGFGDTSEMWWNQVPFFSKRYRVFTYDVRGSGKSDRPKEEWTMETLVEDLSEVWKMGRTQIAMEMEEHDELEEIVRPPFYLGFSMGGRIVTEYAIKYPDLVKGLIIANSSLGMATPSPEAQERRRTWAELLQKRDMKKFAEVMTTSAFSPNFRDKDKKTFEKYKKIKQGNKADGISNLMKAMQSATTAPDLSQIKCPTLIIAGENDGGGGPEVAKKVQQAIAGSQLVVLPTGHAAPTEAPEQFNQAVFDFLQAVKGSQ